MSKIGKKPISLTSAKVEIKGNIVRVQGPNGAFEHVLPPHLKAEQNDKGLFISTDDRTGKSNMLWGLHRALLANKIKGVQSGFEQVVKIVGLGYKAQLSGNKLIFSLGFSHKIDYDLPPEVTVEVDKSGQSLLFKSADKFQLGRVCDTVCSFRPPEPYKGTGVMRADALIIRKAGKTKSS